jgi:hypothetical protein
MKTIEITLNNESDFKKVNALLSQLKLNDELKITEKKQKPDPVTLCSQESLAEEWDSEEDNRWDKLL